MKKQTFALIIKLIALGLITYWIEEKTIIILFLLIWANYIKREKKTQVDQKPEMENVTNFTHTFSPKETPKKQSRFQDRLDEMRKQKEGQN